jgi:hypothetical protein
VGSEEDEDADDIVVASRVDMSSKDDSSFAILRDNVRRECGKVGAHNNEMIMSRGTKVEQSKAN